MSNSMLLCSPLCRALACSLTVDLSWDFVNLSIFTCGSRDGNDLVYYVSPSEISHNASMDNVLKQLAGNAFEGHWSVVGCSSFVFF